MGVKIIKCIFNNQSLSRSIEMLYEKLDLVFHRDIQTQENNVWKHECVALVFSYKLFSCVWISSLSLSLSLFIYNMHAYMTRFEPCNLFHNISIFIVSIFIYFYRIYFYRIVIFYFPFIYLHVLKKTNIYSPNGTINLLGIFLTSQSQSHISFINTS